LEFDKETESDRAGSEAALERLSVAAECFQLLAPKGWQNIAWTEGDLYQSVGPSSVIKGTALVEPTWARIYHLSNRDLSEFRPLLASLDKAIADNSIRIINPFRLLQNGMFSSEVYVRHLLFVAGLDALLMAGGRSNFVERLKRLLGSTSLVFPPLGYAGYTPQPSYTVEGLADDMFQLRSTVAHGGKIPSKFLETVTGFPLPGLEDRTYSEVLCDAAIALLCAALRTVLLDPALHRDIKSEKKWRARLSQS